MTRKTYHYDPASGQMVEGPSPPRSAGSGDGWRFSDRLYSGKPFLAHDGTVIDSKKKHREYMRRHGLTTMDDFKDTWKQKAKEREAFYKGTDQKRKAEIRQELSRVIDSYRSR